MFDQYARELLEGLPKLPGLDPTDCRRTLSRAYLLVVNGHIQAEDAAADGETVEQLGTNLRRMINALESVAVFDPLNGIDVAARPREASAFVAAEALFLLGELETRGAPKRDALIGDPIQDVQTYSLIESGLLYMIGGYDINAVAVTERVPAVSGAESGNGESAYTIRCLSGTRLLRRIVALCRGEITPIVGDDLPAMGKQSGLITDLVDETRTRLYEALAVSLDEYLAWLGSGGIEQRAQARIERVRQACKRPISAAGNILVTGSFADIYHLASLLAAALEATQRRAVVHIVPPPTEGDPTLRGQFGSYIRERARGSDTLKGRPLLWPSTLEYIRECLPGPRRDAVVSMPTGSGKSFLAELAVAHALPRGWVLYLAPTNALAHQIRRDLARALMKFSGVTVVAFVGGAEYTALSDEKMEAGAFIAVMTPEKCALALRLYPAVFSQCALCVFDECHLLNDPGRGATADILLAQLFKMAPNMRILLMSAMISNANELAEWLTSVRGLSAVPSKIKWRPSRAARGFVFVDKIAQEKAREDFDKTFAAAVGSKTDSRGIPLGWIAGLSGPWTLDGAADYRTSRLPVEATLTRKRSRKGEVVEEFESWKNETGRAVAELFAARGLPSINFVLSSRHHAFGIAERVSTPMPDALGVGTVPPLVESQLAVADAELGVETRLRELLRKGISVHTSAMLQVEQAAAEWMFTNGKAKLMIATGTLAQGLNLPAIAVVVSGSKLGNPQALRDIDATAGLTRANELILNGFGRAGRPGFANQGVVVLVSDKPFSARVVPTLSGEKVIESYPVLCDPDASVEVRSPIEKFLDELMAMETEENATKLEVALTSLLSAFDDPQENAGTILRRTFAGYRRRAVFTGEKAVLANKRVADVKARFLERHDVPAWMPQAAMKAGVDFFRAQRMWEAYKERGVVGIQQFSSYSVRAWFDVFMDVLSHMPVGRVGDYLDPAQTPTPRTKLNALATSVDEYDVVPWKKPDGWKEAWHELSGVVLAYMEGKPFTTIGGLLFGKPPSEFSSKRNDGARGLPPVFKFIGDVIERTLSVDAGCFLALHECFVEAERPGGSVPELLQALPLCIRNGCDSLDVLAWFRFGFRQRVCAHALAKAFPVPENVHDDSGRAKFVGGARRKWLNGELDAPNDPLLAFARVIIREGTSERT